MLCKRGHAVSEVSMCLCVCPSRLWTVKTNKHIFKIFAPSGSHTILVFLYQTAWQYSDGTHITGALNAAGVGRNRDSQPISGFIACFERCDGELLSTRLSADTWLSIDACWSSVQWCITDCHGASLFTAQKATHQ